MIPHTLCSAGQDIDGMLARAGYRVRSSDLCHVAHRLEKLDSAMVSDVQSGGEHHNLESAATIDAVHYNPSDLAAWVDSMLHDLDTSNPPLPPGDVWAGQTLHTPPTIQPHQAAAMVAARRVEEDLGIRLVHLLMSCAAAFHRGDAVLACELVEEIRLALSGVNTGFGIGKVAGYFADALVRRLYSLPPLGNLASPAEEEILYHHFYEAAPYIKFAHFTANQAILEAFQCHDHVHVIDFNLMHGLQWPALIQALALRPGGPPSLRLTGIGLPSPDGRDSLREVGLRLAELAWSVRVRFTFRGVAANRLDDVRPWMLQVAPGEAVAVNSVMQLHRLLGDPDAPTPSPVESVLGWIHELHPRIVTVVEQEADHNKPGFVDRFTEALFYYSTMFDSLEAGQAMPASHQRRQHQAIAEVYLQWQISDILCSEGVDRTERHEPLARWRERLFRAGLRPVHLGSNAFKQASMLLTLFSSEGYCVEEEEGCLMLGWHNRRLMSASAWRAADNDTGDERRPIPESFIFNSSSVSPDGNTAEKHGRNHSGSSSK